MKVEDDGGIWLLFPFWLTCLLVWKARDVSFCQHVFAEYAKVKISMSAWWTCGLACNCSVRAQYFQNKCYELLTISVQKKAACICHSTIQNHKQ